MLTAIFTNQFKKDYKLVKKRDLRMEDLDMVLEKLIAGRMLEPRYKDKGIKAGGSCASCRNQQILYFKT